MTDTTTREPTPTPTGTRGVLDRAAAALEAAVADMPRVPTHAGRRVATALRAADGRLVVVCA